MKGRAMPQRAFVSGVPTHLSPTEFERQIREQLPNVIDVTLLVNKLKELEGAISTEIADVHPCIPNGIINALDVALEVDALKGVPCYCSPPCH